MDKYLRFLRNISKNTPSARGRRRLMERELKKLGNDTGGSNPMDDGTSGRDES
jgi:hypothetical protein